ncbi:MAG TPA: UTP--glucose-1-phosphate uridylyltransferase [Patescibacteria group bacterium]|nr:UTP--glucose-1-phosphate uridylyltransferase [Patescibacteria group bacterium]
MSKKVRKAIIPAAGYGTRFLPATKAQPKEMLPVVDKPIIQYVVEDAVSAGIEDIIIVTGWHKRSIEDHFDYPFELEKRLEASGKESELEQIRKIAEMANFHYVRQKGPLGNATPIWNARHIVGDEPFLVLWGDEFIDAHPTRSQQLTAAYEKLGGSAVLAAIRKNSPEDYKRYGYAAGKELESGVLKIEDIVEKPGVGKIDSPYAVVSAAVYDPEMFSAIEEAMRDFEAGKLSRELVYVDAVNILLKRQKACWAVEIQNGKYYDCGNKLEYLKTVVEMGLQHPDLKKDFLRYLVDMTELLRTQEQSKAEGLLQRIITKQI